PRTAGLLLVVTRAEGGGIEGESAAAGDGSGGLHGRVEEIVAHDRPACQVLADDAAHALGIHVVVPDIAGRDVDGRPPLASAAATGRQQDDAIRETAGIDLVFEDAHELARAVRGAVRAETDVDEIISRFHQPKPLSKNRADAAACPSYCIPRIAY